MLPTPTNIYLWPRLIILRFAGVHPITFNYFVYNFILPATDYNAGRCIDFDLVLKRAFKDHEYGFEFSYINTYRHEYGFDRKFERMHFKQTTSAVVDSVKLYDARVITAEKTILDDEEEWLKIFSESDSHDDLKIYETSLQFIDTLVEHLSGGEPLPHINDFMESDSDSE